MKRRRIDVKKLFLVIFGLVVLGVAYLSWSVRRSEIPRHLYKIIDGNTIVFSGGKTVKLLGVDSSAEGKVNEPLIKQYLSVLLSDKNVWLEYDKYIKDASGFDLVWVWVGCEDAPKFWAARGVDENPVNCEKGALVNEQLIKIGWSKVYFPEGMGEVRYEKRINSLR